MRTFRIINDELIFGGVTVATMAPHLSASLRDELAQFLDGLTMDVMPFKDVDALEAEARADAHAQGLSEGYDTGYRDGHDAALLLFVLAPALVLSAAAVMAIIGDKDNET